MGKYPVIFCDFKVRVSSLQTFQKTRLHIAGSHRRVLGGLSDFRSLVSRLYMKWKDCLVQSLKLPERTYFESIRNKTATKADLMKSLYRLSYFLAQKFRQRVIVLIDEYEAPNNRAYDHGYFGEVRSLCPSL